MHIRSLIRVLGVATLVSMVVFYALMLMCALYGMGKISFCPTTVDFGVALGTYIACFASLALAEHRYSTEAECYRA